MTTELPAPLVPAEVDLNERFAKIRAFYRRHHDQIMADGNEWFAGPYAWSDEDDTGIRLTPIEYALWTDIRRENCVLYPQYPVGRYFVDFGNPVHRVAIECDGAGWHTDREKDLRRQRQIEARGWTVYRISGRVCFTDFTEVDDDHGNPVPLAGQALELIRSIDARHGLSRRRGGLGSTGLRRSGDVVALNFQRLAELAKRETR